MFEMPVVDENVGQTFTPHRLHRNAIREAVRFAGTLGVEIKAGEKGFMALREDADVLVCNNLTDRLDGTVSQPGIDGEERQELA